jgi:hypothetical protein
MGREELLLHNSSRNVFNKCITIYSFDKFNYKNMEIMELQILKKTLTPKFKPL